MKSCVPKLYTACAASGAMAAVAPGGNGASCVSPPVVCTYTPSCATHVSLSFAQPTCVGCRDGVTKVVCPDANVRTSILPDAIQAILSPDGEMANESTLDAMTVWAPPLTGTTCSVPFPST